jgi:molybdate transport system substrate-binding protein
MQPWIDKAHMMTRLLMCFLTMIMMAAPVQARDLVVFAAASLKGPLDEIAGAFGDITISYGGSGALARQVASGAPADVILLANADWMRHLSTAEAVKKDSVVQFASNRLVLIGPAGAEPLPLTSQALLSALQDGPLAMGFTSSVPAGIYGKEALVNLGLWDTVVPFVAQVDTVRSALALVTRGEAPLGIVYQSDVLISSDVTIRARLPETAHAPIQYLGALTTEAGHIRAAEFLGMLLAQEGHDIFIAAHFCPAEGC